MSPDSIFILFMLGFEKIFGKKEESGLRSVLPRLESALKDFSPEDREVFKALNKNLNSFLFSERGSL